MSDSVQPHRWQPTRLLCPWDSPSKNTGVGSHFLLQCMKVKSESEVAQSCLTLRDPMDCSPPGSSVHGIFQARVLEWGAIAYSVNLHYTPLNGTSSCPLWQTVLDQRWLGQSLSSHMFFCSVTLPITPPSKGGILPTPLEVSPALCFETALANGKVFLCHFWGEPWIDLEAFTFLLLEAKHHRRRAMTLRPPSHVEGLWKMGCYEKRDG